MRLTRFLLPLATLPVLTVALAACTESKSEVKDDAFDAPGAGPAGPL